MKQLKEHNYSCNVHISWGVTFVWKSKIPAYLFIYLVSILVSSTYVYKENKAFWRSCVKRLVHYYSTDGGSCRRRRNRRSCACRNTCRWRRAWMAFVREAAGPDLLYNSRTGLCRHVCKMFCLKVICVNNSLPSAGILLLIKEICVYVLPFPSSSLLSINIFLLSYFHDRLQYLFFSQIRTYTSRETKKHLYFTKIILNFLLQVHNTIDIELIFITSLSY